MLNSHTLDTIKERNKKEVTINWFKSQGQISDSSY